VVLGPLFPIFGSRSRPKFERNGIMGGKEKFPASKYGIIFGYPFEGFTHGLDCERRRVDLGPLFPNSGSRSRPTFERSLIMGGKEKIPTSKYGIMFDYPFEGCNHGASEDVWFFGLFSPTPGPVLGPRLNEVGLWVEKKSSLLPNMETYLDTHLRDASLVLISSEDVLFLGHIFPTLCLVLGPRLNGVVLSVKKKCSPLPNMDSYLDTHLSVALVGAAFVFSSPPRISCLNA